MRHLKIFYLGTRAGACVEEFFLPSSSHSNSGKLGDRFCLSVAVANGAVRKGMPMKAAALSDRSIQIVIFLLSFVGH